MSPQNIAIVMSPNLLWSSETSDIDYVSKVNSTASVNTIVEALVTDWSYYFGDEFTINDFYITMTRDELFPHNGGFPVDRDHTNDISSMTKSLNIPTATSSSNNHTQTNIAGSQPNQCATNFNLNNAYQTHSRSSSHDTSLILLENQLTAGSTDSLTKRSQSNSSLSDSSPPHQSSPKLPIRRKNNKKSVAPTPPDNQRFQRSSEYYGSINSGSHQSETMQAMKERFLNANSSLNASYDDSKFNSNRFLRSETKAQNTNSNATFKHPNQSSISMKKMSGSTENLTTKPDKPPRPAMPNIESQTLVRNAFKAKGNERHNRPIALPRNIMNVARSTENLFSASSSSSPIKTPTNVAQDDSETIQFRDQNNDPNRGDKPAIPERPTSLMKPNFRTAVFDKFDTNQLNNHSPDHSPSGIKKTQSFRMSSTPGTAVGSITGRSLTTLERTHIYNVDKKQVEIIDVDQQSSSNDSSTDSTTSAKMLLDSNVNGNGKTDKIQSNDDSIVDEQKLHEPSDKNTRSASPVNLMSNSTNNDNPMPPSPRLFDPKLIKRPQIPAPPPPNHAPNQSNESNSQNNDQITPKKVEAIGSGSVITSPDSTNL